jgi:hypothetical protein
MFASGEVFLRSPSPVNLDLLLPKLVGLSSSHGVLKVMVYRGRGLFKAAIWRMTTRERLQVVVRLPPVR